MDHISANLAFVRREKIFGGTKSSRGAKNQPIKKTKKKWRPFFFFFFETKKICGGRQKNEQGAPNGNVTPLKTSRLCNIQISDRTQINRQRSLALTVMSLSLVRVTKS